ncbi:MAG: HYR domain-containing protein, partial [Planctomycetota bacterium]
DLGVCGAVATWAEPSSTDNCAIATLTADAASGDLFPVGLSTVTYTTTDIHGNSASASFTVTVNDTEAPAIVGLPADITLSSDTGFCGAVATWTEPTSVDNCAIATLTADAASGDFFPVGVTTVTYATTDIHGNLTAASFTVTVIDTEAPAITDLPADLELTTDAGQCGAVATWIEPGSTDNCAIAGLTATAASGDFFPVGTSTITYTTTDIHGNETSASFTVSVTDDELPTISDVPADILLEADLGLCTTAAFWATPSAADNCGIAELVATHSSGDTFALGITTVQYTTTDLAGNSTQASFTVTVIDTQSPQLIDVPSDMIMPNQAGQCGKPVSWAAPSAVDNCAIGSLTSDHQPGEFFPVGDTTVTYTAVDPSGNSSQASFTITIEDTELPTMLVGADLVLPAEDAVCFATVSVPVPAVADNCGVAELTNDLTGTADASGVYQRGTTTITWTLTDIHGNTVSALQSVTITVDETDCNGNGTPDVCDLADGASVDCNLDGIPDECQTDCNGNGVPDDCDIAASTSEDTNANGIPDECEPEFIRGDANGNGSLEFVDGIFLLQYLTGTGATPGCLDAADVNDDEALNLVDPIYLLLHIFASQAPPPAPHLGCGIDGNGVSIGCETFNACP